MNHQLKSGPRSAGHLAIKYSCADIISARGPLPQAFHGAEWY